MNKFGLTLVILLLGQLLPVTARAANLIASEPATIYYTTNGAAPVTTSPESQSSTVAGITSRFAAPSYSSTSAFTNGAYSLDTTPHTWVGTDADRLKPSSTDYASTYGDESTVTYTLPWAFTFYGQSYSQITADTNGNIWFQNGNSAHSFDLASTGRGPVIALWNDDLSSYYYGGVFIQYVAGSGRVVIEWQTETYTDEGNYLTNNFEAVLFQDGSIRIDYKTFNAANSQDFGSGISQGDGSFFLSLTTNYGPVYTLGGNSYLFTTAPPVDPALNIIFSGTGSGMVTSTPTGIACNTNCSAQFLSGTQVTLHPAASQYSLFTGWTNGTCSGAGDCLLTLNADSSVTTVFDYDTAHQVQINNGTPAYYASIQSAYDATAEGAVIKLWATTYNESLICNRSVSVTLQGGYNSTYSSLVGEPVLNGALTITDGTLVMDGFIIQ